VVNLELHINIDTLGPTHNYSPVIECAAANREKGGAREGLAQNHKGGYPGGWKGRGRKGGGINTRCALGCPRNVLERRGGRWGGPSEVEMGGGKLGGELGGMQCRSYDGDWDKGDGRLIRGVLFFGGGV